jgi:gamma-glutamylcyclotransferase (GGCT)/AIG2-like uncharacterized protein YtfP
VTARPARAWSAALRHVVEALTRLGIDAQAAGGLAARAWGGCRDLVDLDFFVADRALSDAARHLHPSVSRGPARVRSDRWDMTVLELVVEGCRVELGGADSGRYRDTAGSWHPAAVDFAAGVTRTVFGVSVPVMPRASLIAYKTALGREVDLVDLHELTGCGGPVDTRLAVYGTLAPGAANHHVVADLRGSWMPGVVHGELEPTGWGTTYGFPAFRWQPDAATVPVRLLRSTDLPAAWARLDEFEGPGYRRVLVPVTVGAERVLANIYAVQGAP